MDQVTLPFVLLLTEYGDRIALLFCEEGLYEGKPDPKRPIRIEQINTSKTSRVVLVEYLDQFSNQARINVFPGAEATVVYENKLLVWVGRPRDHVVTKPQPVAQRALVIAICHVPIHLENDASIAILVALVRIKFARLELCCHGNLRLRIRPMLLPPLQVLNELLLGMFEIPVRSFQEEKCARRLKCPVCHVRHSQRRERVLRNDVRQAFDVGLMLFNRALVLHRNGHSQFSDTLFQRLYFCVGFFELDLYGALLVSLARHDLLRERVIALSLNLDFRFQLLRDCPQRALRSCALAFVLGLVRIGPGSIQALFILLLCRRRYRRICQLSEPLYIRHFNLAIRAGLPSRSCTSFCYALTRVAAPRDAVLQRARDKADTFSVEPRRISIGMLAVAKYGVIVDCARTFCTAKCSRLRQVPQERRHSEAHKIHCGFDKLGGVSVWLMLVHIKAGLCRIHNALHTRHQLLARAKYVNDKRLGHGGIARLEEHLIETYGTRDFLNSLTLD
eukprot:Opistho-2@59966